MRLRGKSVLVSGAAKNIGREIALAMAAEGAKVAITYLRSSREAEATVRKLGDAGAEAMAVRCDVRDAENVAAAVKEVAREFGGIDILVNNAGAYKTTEFEKISSDEWDEMMETNAKGPFLMSQAAVKHLRNAKGRIVNVGSLGGIRPWATHAHYCASKAALHMLTQASAKALAPEVTVNAVAPGMIVTGAGDKKLLQRFAAKTPAKRNGMPQDVADAVLYFATCTNFITGQILVVDGGLSLE